MTPRKMLVLFGGGTDQDAAAWKTAVIANGGSVSSSTLRAVSNFCRQAKGAGVWSKLTRVNLVCGDQLAAAQVPLLVGGGSTKETLTNIVAGDYVETGATAGIKGNGTNKSFDTGWNPVSLSSSMSSLGLWGYVKGTESGAASRILMGSYNVSSNVTALGWLNNGTTSYETGAIAALGGSEFSPPGTPATTEGFLGTVTNGSRSQQYYKNGAALGSPVTASGAFVNTNLIVLGASNAGTPSTWSTRYLRAYAFTTGMSASDTAAFNTVMQTFQSALSRNV